MTEIELLLLKRFCIGDLAMMSTLFLCFCIHDIWLIDSCYKCIKIILEFSELICVSSLYWFQLQQPWICPIFINCSKQTLDVLYEVWKFITIVKISGKWNTVVEVKLTWPLRAKLSQNNMVQMDSPWFSRVIISNALGGGGVELATVGQVSSLKKMEPIDGLAKLVR